MKRCERDIVLSVRYHWLLGRSSWCVFLYLLGEVLDLNAVLLEVSINKTLVCIRVQYIDAWVKSPLRVKTLRIMNKV